MSDDGFDFRDPKWWTIGGGALLALIALLKGYIRLPREVEELQEQLIERKNELDQARAEIRQKDVEIKKWMEFAMRSVISVEKSVQVAKAIDKAERKPQ